MLEHNRIEGVGKAVLDLAKILFAAQLASAFFAKAHWAVLSGSFAMLVIFFVGGWWMLPPKKGE